MKEILGGVTAAVGFKAAGVYCGVKKSNGAYNSDSNKDLALIVSEKPCAAAAMYTLNQVKAAPLYLTMEHLENGVAQAVIVNSGNANACCPNSQENAKRMSIAAAKATGLQPTDFIVSSTGVIGQELNIEAIEQGMEQAVAGLSDHGSDAAANAIMTTDTVKKETAVTCEIGGKTVTIGAIAKGSGMIHPNMGTMLCFVTTDCAITHEMLDTAIRGIVPRTFNRVTVDGDTSTNDTCAVLANGMAENPVIDQMGDMYETFYQALYQVLETLARAIASDGEGASKLITCKVSGAFDEDNAERMAKEVVGSPLVKTAVFGCDANWGRVLCAMGYSHGQFTPECVSIMFKSIKGEILVCQGGEGLPFDEDVATAILSEKEVIIDIQVKDGDGSATCWGCDLTYEYVKINGDYRT